jgi:SAM-dependent methyltransferase
VAAAADDFNAAAERHWASMAADPDVRGQLLQKPFANLREAPAMLYRLGLALEALDLGAGHTVLDFGAGSCWVSRVLNRLGCRTISVDVSRTALRLGEEGFENDPFVRAELGPRFVPYDGRSLSLEDASVDRVLCFDAFHHVPNPREILAELFRVTRPGGRLVMAEPGAGHAHSASALFEGEHYGVLENELVLEQLITDARAAGFDDFEIKPYPEVDNLTLTAPAHLQLLAGDHSLYPLHHVVASMRELHVVAMLKGQPRRDSRKPGVLRAGIRAGVAALEGHAGKEVSVPVRIENMGDTLWLATEDLVGGGHVCLGGHLHDDAGRVLRLGHFTQRLPRDVAPGETVEVEARFALPESAGSYVLRLDMVDARVAWFSQVGSPTTDLTLTVTWSDSLDPHRFEARIEPLGPFPPRVDGNAFSLRLRITNAGDTTWLSGPQETRGTVRVGVQHLSADGAVDELDYFRAPLPGRVAPGESTEVSLTVPLRPQGGRSFAVDLVAEQICWFSRHGSKPLSFELAG